MEKLTPILAGITLLYLVYVLGMRKWDYTSAAKRQEQKLQLQKKGLSVRYYFTSPGTLLFFTLISGGLFTFYWLYKQWQAIRAGYKNAAHTPLKYPPFVRTLLSPVFFFSLIGIINRTCLYLRKPAAWPAWFWGTLWLAGGFAVCLPLPVYFRITGVLVFSLPPYVLQKHINSLPKQLPATKVKLPEIVGLLVCWLCWAGIFLWLRQG